MLKAKQLHPKRAVSFFSGHHRDNEIPALLWLWVALVVILVVRNRAVPTPSQGVTLAVLGGIVVGVGAFTPMIVGVVLLGAIIAAALNVPGLPPALADLETRIQALTTPPAA
jgi:hypothetical protein